MQKRGRVGAMLALVVCGFVQAELRADVIELPPVQDTTLFEDATGRLGNGAGQYLFFGRTWDQNGIDKLLRRALVKFDLSTVPSGSTIDSVSFGFTINQTPPGATGALVSLHTVTSSWGEGASNAPGAEGQGALARTGDATWLHRFHNTELWTTPGGDFVEQAVASTSISSSPESVSFASTPPLVAAIQAWVDNRASNHGWVIIGDEVFQQNARRLLSRENTGPGIPLLQVEFTPPPLASVPVMTRGGLVMLGLLLLFMAWVFVPVSPERIE